MIRIYIDAENWEADQATPLVQLLERLYGRSTLADRTYAVRTDYSFVHDKNNKEKTRYKEWQKACKRMGFTLDGHQRLIPQKNATDIALIGRIMEDVLRLTDAERQQLTVIIVSKDSDFFAIVKALKVVVKQVVVIGGEEMNECHRNCTRFMSFDKMTNDALVASMHHAWTLITDSISKISHDTCLNVTDLEQLLVENDSTYWPWNYRCHTTSELLVKLGVSLGDQSLSVHQLLQTL
ncbi:hypothetical protein GEMRC1_010706 [Eukaryota sp. GEM-RC1]